MKLLKGNLNREIRFKSRPTTSVTTTVVVLKLLEKIQLTLFIPLAFIIDPIKIPPHRIGRAITF